VAEILTKSEVPRHIFIKARNIKINVNPSSVIRADVCEGTDITKLKQTLKAGTSNLYSTKGHHTVAFVKITVSGTQNRPNYCGILNWRKRNISARRQRCKIFQPDDNGARYFSPMTTVQDISAR
jgi:hypothetical protein